MQSQFRSIKPTFTKERVILKQNQTMKHILSLVPPIITSKACCGGTHKILWGALCDDRTTDKVFVPRSLLGYAKKCLKKHRDRLEKEFDIKGLHLGGNYFYFERGESWSKKPEINYETARLAALMETKIKAA